MTYTFYAYGIPVPQPRTRMARLRNGAIVNYDPGTSNDWKSLVALAAREVRPAAPLRGPLSLALEFRMPRPAAHLRKNGELKDGAPSWVCGKGRNDVDNMFKAVADVLTQIRFWEDDGQIALASIAKSYVMAGERPGCLVKVVELRP